MPIGVALSCGGLFFGAMGFLWALFFSVGIRGATTRETIAYNLRDPLTAAFAYGPLALAAALFVGGIVCLVAALIRRRATKRA